MTRSPHSGAAVGSAVPSPPNDRLTSSLPKAPSAARDNAIVIDDDEEERPDHSRPKEAAKMTTSIPTASQHQPASASPPVSAPAQPAVVPHPKGVAAAELAAAAVVDASNSSGSGEATVVHLITRALKREGQGANVSPADVEAADQLLSLQTSDAALIHNKQVLTSDLLLRKPLASGSSHHSELGLGAAGQNSGSVRSAPSGPGKGGTPATIQYDAALSVKAPGPPPPQLTLSTPGGIPLASGRPLPVPRPGTDGGLAGGSAGGAGLSNGGSAGAKGPTKVSLGGSQATIPPSPFDRVSSDPLKPALPLGTSGTAGTFPPKPAGVLPPGLPLTSPGGIPLAPARFVTRPAADGGGATNATARASNGGEVKVANSAAPLPPSPFDQQAKPGAGALEKLLLAATGRQVVPASQPPQQQGQVASSNPEPAMLQGGQWLFLKGAQPVQMTTEQLLAQADGGAGGNNREAPRGGQELTQSHSATARYVLEQLFPDVNKSHIAATMAAVAAGKDIKLYDLLTASIAELRKVAQPQIPVTGSLAQLLGSIGLSGLQAGVLTATAGLQHVDPTRYIIPVGGAQFVRPLKPADPGMAGIAQYGQNIRNARPGPIPGAAAERLNLLQQRDKDQELVKCPSGYCADLSQPPCKEHRCQCCKMNRIAAMFVKQSWCHPCGKRDVVEGLTFVRCGRCKAEMLEGAYKHHLKQQVAVLDQKTGERISARCKDANARAEIVPETTGRRCGKCNNMRPVTFYSDAAGWGVCNMHANRGPPGPTIIASRKDMAAQAADDGEEDGGGDAAMERQDTGEDGEELGGGTGGPQDDPDQQGLDGAGRYKRTYAGDGTADGQRRGAKVARLAPGVSPSSAYSPRSNLLTSAANHLAPAAGGAKKGRQQSGGMGYDYSAAAGDSDPYGQAPLPFEPASMGQMPMQGMGFGGEGMPLPFPMPTAPDQAGAGGMHLGSDGSDSMPPSLLKLEQLINTTMAMQKEVDQEAAMTEQYISSLLTALPNGTGITIAQGIAMRFELLSVHMLSVAQKLSARAAQSQGFLHLHGLSTGMGVPPDSTTVGDANTAAAARMLGLADQMGPATAAQIAQAAANQLQQLSGVGSLGPAINSTGLLADLSIVPGAGGAAAGAAGGGGLGSSAPSWIPLGRNGETNVPDNQGINPRTGLPYSWNTGGAAAGAAAAEAPAAAAPAPGGGMSLPPTWQQVVGAQAQQGGGAQQHHVLVQQTGPGGETHLFLQPSGGRDGGTVNSVQLAQMLQAQPGLSRLPQQPSGGTVVLNAAGQAVQVHQQQQQQPKPQQAAVRLTLPQGVSGAQIQVQHAAAPQQPQQQQQQQQQASSQQKPQAPTPPSACAAISTQPPQNSNSVFTSLPSVVISVSGNPGQPIVMNGDDFAQLLASIEHQQQQQQPQSQPEQQSQPQQVVANSQQNSGGAGASAPASASVQNHAVVVPGAQKPQQVPKQQQQPQLVQSQPQPSAPAAAAQQQAYFMLPSGQQVLLSGPLVTQQQAAQEAAPQARPSMATGSGTALGGTALGAAVGTAVGVAAGAPGAGGMYYTYAPVHIGSGGEVLVASGSAEVGLPGTGSGTGATVAPTLQQIQQAAGPHYTVVMAPHPSGGGGPAAGQQQQHAQQGSAQQFVNILMGPQQGMQGLSLPLHHHLQHQHQVHSVVLGHGHAPQAHQQQGMHQVVAQHR